MPAMSRYTFFLLPLTASVICSPTIQTIFAAQGDSANQLISPALSAYVESLQKSTGLPGIALTVSKIVDGDWVTETKGFGKASDREGHVVDGDTRFGIGSNSKAFTGLGYSYLQHPDGREFDYKERVSSLLPDWKLQDPVAEEYATVLDILSHRNGMPRHDFSYGLEETFESGLKKLGALKPSAEFREVWQYNNMIPYGNAYEAFIHSKIFGPLKMDRTSFEETDYPEDMATGYITLSNGTSFERSYIPDSIKRYIGPCGGVISTGNDIAKWTQFLVDSVRKAEGLSVSKSANETLLRPDAVKFMVGGHQVLNYNDAAILNSSPVYGIGFQRFKYRGLDFVQHGGAVPGFGTQIAWSPMEGVTISVLVNNLGLGNYVANAITFKAFEVLTGLEQSEPLTSDLHTLKSVETKFSQSISDSIGPMPLSKSLSSTFQRTSSKITAFETKPESIPLTAFEGKYTSPGYGEINICFPSTSTSSACQSVYSLLNNSTRIEDPAYPPTPEFDLILAMDSVWVTYLGLVRTNENVFRMTVSSEVVEYKGEKKEYIDPLGDAPVSLTFDIQQGNLKAKGAELRGLWGPGYNAVDKGEVEDYFTRV